MKESLLILMCVLPAVAAAQLPAVAVGSRVRIESSEMGRVKGTLLAQSADSLIVESWRDGRTPISTKSISRFSTSLGRSHSQGAKKGFGYGAVILGGVIGAGIGALIGSESWADVRTVLPRVSVQAAPGQIRGLGLAIGF